MQDYTSYSARIASFNRFPASAEVEPDKLAEAGFYFTGCGDTVRCAYNGCELCEWEAGDVPMADHARSYPDCSFVRRTTNVADACGAGIWRSHANNVVSRGQDSLLLSLQETEIEPRRPGLASGGGITSVTPTINSSGIRETSREEEVQAVMDTDIIQMLMDKGYQDTLLKTVCESFLAEGNGIPMAEKVVEAYWELEEAEEKGKTVVVPVPLTETRVHVDEAVTVVKPTDETQPGPPEHDDTCTNCTSAMGTTAFIPCGHVACCDECANEMDMCALCGATVQATKKM